MVEKISELVAAVVAADKRMGGGRLALNIISFNDEFTGYWSVNVFNRGLKKNHMPDNICVNMETGEAYPYLSNDIDSLIKEVQNAK